MSRRRGVAVGIGAALVVATGVVAVDVARAPAAGAALAPFDSCEELTAWYRDGLSAQVGAYGLGGGTGGWAVSAADAGPVAATSVAVGGGGARGEAAGSDGAAATGGAVGSSGTGTNVQEAGVDEPALLKVADGQAFALHDERLVVVDLAAGAVLGEVDLAPGWAGGATGGAPGGDGLAEPSSQRWSRELLLVGDRVVVLGSGTLPAPVAAAGAGLPGVTASAGLLPGWGPSTTTVTTVDVSDPTAPAVVDRVEVEGGYVSARASGAHVRLVTTATPRLPFVDPWLLGQTGSTGSTAELEALALEHNLRLVQDATAADWLPDVVERAEDGAVAGSEPVGCETVHHPRETAGAGTVTVLTLDPASTDTLVQSTSVSADGSFVYAGPDRLYVATTRGGWAWAGPADGDADPASGAARTSTQLHGFDTGVPGRTTYVASGEVDGRLFGSWALDARDGYLRVGTTLEDGASTDGAAAPDPPAPDGAAVDPGGRPPPVATSSSAVVVLQETGDDLVQVGRVDGLGPGEQIRSLRWFDDLAVVVTFEQTDPLYTVDLSVPTRPEVLGELKVLGYSGYLHPVGDGLLLGVGQDGDAAGQLLGTKVETYDVSDLAAPVAVDATTWPGSSSPVESDSRLFAYLPAGRSAVLPLERWNADGSSSTGLVAVTVGPDGAVAESGHWYRDSGGWTSAVATAEDQVVVLGEDRDQQHDVEQHDVVQVRAALTVLAGDGLDVLAEAPLG